MKNIWYVVNIALVALALPGGYRSLSPEKLRHTNPDAIACCAILLLMPLFAIWSVQYSIQRWNHRRLARPSLSRNPLNWWHDPLQSLFISTCIAGSSAIGGAFGVPRLVRLGSGHSLSTFASLLDSWSVRFWFTGYIAKTSSRPNAVHAHAPISTPDNAVAVQVKSARSSMSGYAQSDDNF
jgi:hypothetical protein